MDSTSTAASNDRLPDHLLVDVLQAYYDLVDHQQHVVASAYFGIESEAPTMAFRTAKWQATTATLALGLVCGRWLEPSRRVALRLVSTSNALTSLAGVGTAPTFFLSSHPKAYNYIRAVIIDLSSPPDNLATFPLALGRSAVGLTELNLNVGLSQLSDAALTAFAGRHLERLTLGGGASRAAAVAHALSIVLSGVAAQSLRSLDISALAEDSYLPVLKTLNGRSLPVLRTLKCLGRQWPVLRHPTQPIRLAAPMLDTIVASGATAVVLAHAMSDLAGQAERLRLDLSPGCSEPFAFQLQAQTVRAFRQLQKLLVRTTSFGAARQSPFQLGALLALPETLRALELDIFSVASHNVLQSWTTSPYTLKLEQLTLTLDNNAAAPVPPVWLVDWCRKNSIELDWIPQA